MPKESIQCWISRPDVRSREACGYSPPQISSLQTPGGTTSYSYDPVGRVHEIALRNSGGTLLDYQGYQYDPTGLVTNILRLGDINAVYGYEDLGQLTSAQAFEPGGGLRLNENLGYAYDAAGNLAWRTNNDFLQSFTCDAADELVNITRSGALTAAGSVTGAVTQLGINGTPTQIYSDGTFATTNGLTLRDGINLFVSAGTNAAGPTATEAGASQSVTERLLYTHEVPDHIGEG